ncbi:unnamed protein product [Plutella xylostella]|uniref:(diamondback moth) hypothetical protein n=1 Tax=Plutella xylostella TaxID=51655 RepID=A0A8S4EWF8_PLUXY|nr:unnamed protein product [Plutella xylostella]
MSVNNGNHYNSAIYIRACRSCLNSKPTNYVLLQNEWIDMYKACINVDITDKEQTFALCDNCSIILKQCFEFKEKCLKSEIFWNTLSDTKPISTSNEDEFKKIIKEANVNIKSENLSICADTQDYEDNQIAGDDMVLVVVARLVSLTHFESGP